MLIVEGLQAWTASEPSTEGGLEVASRATSDFLASAAALLARLPSRSRSNPEENEAREAIGERANAARERFLAVHAASLYEALTEGYAKPLRVEELVDKAASRVPFLVPSPSELASERLRKLPDKQGAEIAQGILIAHFLALPRAGRHLLEAMLRPLPESLERLPELERRGSVDLGPARVTRRGRAGVVELCNPSYLNAEDSATLGPTECAVDLVLMDDSVDVGVIRGGVVEHAGYANGRVFGSGLNLTHLYEGRLDFLFYIVRDLGYVNKIYRGLFTDARAAEWPAGEAEIAPTREQLFIAAVESLAVGGACQLLHVVDHVIATRGARLFLPARKEGIIPGASNLRLPRFVGDRAARQAILSGREWTAGEEDASLLCDEVVAPEEMERALDERIDALTSSGLVNAAANRRAIRIGEEPIEQFRQYMAQFARDQAYCHASTALVRNLEVHWRARKTAG